MALLLFICGDVELNPGPKNIKSYYYFSLYHWNLNSLPSHDFSKLSLIEAYNPHHNFDMICLFETYVDSSYADDDTRLNLDRADNPHNCKRGGVSIYFKEHMAVLLVSPLNLHECLVLEINIQNKKGYVFSLYRSPSQSKDEFDQLLLNFEQLIFDRISQNLHFILVTGDFNVRSSSWWKNDLTTSKGSQVDAITSSYVLSQLIRESTHVLQILFSCINLIFINQNNFIMDSDTQASLHPNYHHQIVYANLNLKIEYPPLYERLVWDYKTTNTQLLNRTIETFNWEKLLENENADEQLYLFNKTMLNIFHNFIQDKNTICNGKDSPWFNNQIKTVIEKKNNLFKSYMANGRLAVDRVRLQKAGAELINIIKPSKENFYNNLAKKLNDPSTSSKTYWSIIKTFINGKKNPIISWSCSWSWWNFDTNGEVT